MAYCPHCGAQYQAPARFCPNCGQPTDASLATGATNVAVDTVPVRLRTSIPDFVQQALYPGEQVLGAFNASFIDHRREGEFRHDKYVLTDQRVIFYHTGIIHKGMDEMPYRTLTRVSYDRGWIHGKVIIEAATAKLEINGISNDDALFAEKIISGTLAGRRFVAAP